MSKTTSNLPQPSDDDPWGYHGRHTVVTGAASGIGKSTCEILIALGATVTALDVQPIEIPGIARTHRVDLADPTSIADVARTIGGGEPVDALFNCAGIPGTADKRKIIAVNFCGLRMITELLVPAMPSGSAVCCVGSTAAVNWPFHLEPLLDTIALDDFDEALDLLDAQLAGLGYPYDVSKEAVNVYVAWRAISLNPIGIRINCVNPGGTFTPATREFSKAVRAKAGGAEYLEHWPTLMGRMARPDEQAWPMVFLNSAFASFANGASICIDAGLTSGMFTRQHHPAVAAGMSWRQPR